MAAELEDLLSTIGRSIRDTLRAVEEHSLTRYLDYFETKQGPNGNLVLEPKTVTIPLPTADGTYQPREIPIVALMNHNSLQIEDLRLKFHVDLDDQSSDQNGAPKLMARLAPPRPPGPLLRGDSHGHDGKDSFAEVEVHFKRGEPNEGIARIAGNYHRIL